MKARKWSFMSVCNRVSIVLFIFLAGNTVLSQEWGVISINENKAWRLRLALSPTYYNTSGVKPVSIPVNSEDAGFLSGNTVVKAKSGIDYAVFDIGAAKVFNIDSWDNGDWSILPKIGFDAKISLLSLEKDGSDRALFQVKQQSSDTRPASEGSFVYDKLTPGVFTPIPFVGLDINYGGWTISPELGLSYKEFKREFGDYRWGTFSSTGSSDEWAPSLRPLLRVGYGYDGDAEIGIFGSYENYRYSFGHIQCFSFGFSTIVKF